MCLTYKTGEESNPHGDHSEGRYQPALMQDTARMKRARQRRGKVHGFAEKDVLAGNEVKMHVHSEEKRMMT